MHRPLCGNNQCLKLDGSVLIWIGIVHRFRYGEIGVALVWTYGEPEEFITILELPPVTDAKSAVKVGVAYQIKRAENEL
jgi:hypothetical protein